MVVLSTHLLKSTKLIRNLVPKDTHVVQYGRAQQLNGSDIIQGWELVSLGEDGQDMSFVQVWFVLMMPLAHSKWFHQYELYVDKYAHRKNHMPEFELRKFFGQVLYFFVINVPGSATNNIQAETYIYAAIHKAKTSESSNDHFQIQYYQDLGHIDIIDLNQVKCVIGHIWDHGKWAIVDCSGNVQLS